MANTPKRGKYRWIVFRQGTEWVAAALEFNIVEVGDDPQVVYLEMQDAVKGYIEAASKIKGFRDQAVNPMLNQQPEEEYEILWNKAREEDKQKNHLPDNVFQWGVASLAMV